MVAAGTPIAVMAHLNRWQVLNGWPTQRDGAPIAIEGGPFQRSQYSAVPPVVSGVAGYWPFVASTVDAMSRAGRMYPHALSAMQFPGDLPRVHLYPNAWRASATSFTQEVSLESGEFNDRYAIFSDSARTVYQLISPLTMQHLLSLPPVDELWTVGNSLCMSRLDPHSSVVLAAHLQTLTTIANGIPSSAWEQPEPGISGSNARG